MKRKIFAVLLTGAMLTAGLSTTVFADGELSLIHISIQTKIYAEENAVLHLIQVQRLGSKMTFLDDFGADCEKNARMETIQLVLGGKDTYLGNRTALRGEDVYKRQVNI